MSVVPFAPRATAKAPLSSTFAGNSDLDTDTLGCVRFTLEEMQALTRIHCDAETGETVFKDVTLRASSDEAGYNFKLAADKSVYMSIGKIRNGGAFAYMIVIGQEPSLLRQDFADIIELAEAVRDAAIPEAQQLQKKATLSAQISDRHRDI